MSESAAAPGEGEDDIMAGPFAERVLAVVAKEGMIDQARLAPDATLEELEVASIDVVMILNGLEEEFGIYIPVDQTITDVKTVRDLVAAVHRLVVAKEAGAR